jgi:hypothetical protein
MSDIGGAQCLRRGRDAGVMRSGKGACVLVATAVAHRSRRYGVLTKSISMLCSAHAWIRVALNIFDASPGNTLSLYHVLPSCVTLSTLNVFKTRFWQLMLVPERLRVSHVFLVDADMDISPTAFDLVTLIRISEATNISILSPAPFGSGKAFFHLDSPRMNNNYKVTQMSCGKKPSMWGVNCAVCRQGVVEVKTPLFTLASWRVIHERLLAVMPDEALAGGYVAGGRDRAGLESAETPW